jgi:hypothetical protein
MRDLVEVAEKLVQRVSLYLDTLSADRNAPPDPELIRYLSGRNHEEFNRLARLSEGQAPEPRSPLRASSAGDCPRKLGYRLHMPEAEEPVPPRIQRTFGIGNKLHDLEREYLVGAGIPILAEEELIEVEILPGVVLQGHLDNIIELDDEAWIIDFKTMSPIAFERFLRDGMEDKHRDQLHIYMHAKKIPRAILYAINKGTSEAAAIAIEYDHSITEQVFDRMRAAALSTPDRLPDRPYPPRPMVKFYKRDVHKNYAYWDLDWQCSYCPFAHQCRVVEDGYTPVYKGEKTYYHKDMTPAELEAYLAAGSDDAGEACMTLKGGAE